MKSQSILFLSCFILVHTLIPNAATQGTAKVQEFFKKYFGEYFPKTTRSYTLYGNGLNGPADFNAGLPISEDMQEGPIQNIIIRRGSPSLKNSSPGQSPSPAGGSHPAVAQQSPTAHQLPATQQIFRAQQLPGASRAASGPAGPGPSHENTWQPTSFDPVAFSKGGHRGRSDLTSEFDDEPQIITAEDAQQIVGSADATREFRIESSMSFNPGF
ncbi:unnamed protein product [Orchesella dallaii]|uniref:Uncharacterized protein n=1 Tax=Orchesella dallaii TaxID=48710 RepID=A0ABP1QX58_9HEXA